MLKLSQKTLDEFTKQLEKQRASIEKELTVFASRNKNVKGDWNAKYPRLDKNENVDLEEEANEVEEYIIRLPIEHSLEKRLQDTHTALENIRGGTYGMCKNCNKQIPLKRMEIYPEANICLDCLAKRDK